MSRAFRRTKIVATLGPATDDDQLLEQAIRAGLDVARINFSHGDTANQTQRVEKLRAAAARAGCSNFANVIPRASIAGGTISVTSKFHHKQHINWRTALLRKRAAQISTRLRLNATR